MDFLARLAAAMLLAFASATAAHAAYTFQPFNTIATGSKADAATVGDVDGDGRDDIVATTTFNFDPEYDHQVVVWLQQPDGSLLQPVRFPYGAGPRTGLVLGNLDDDPALEIVVGHRDGIMVIDWDLQRGPPTVTTRQFNASPIRAAEDIGLLDADRDGALDVIAQSWSQGAVLYLGDGAGGFRSSVAVPTPVSGYNDLDIGDFDSDGHDDFVVFSGQGTLTQAYIYFNTGSTTFGPPTVIHPNPGEHVSLGAVGVGDFDRDGRDDLAIMRGPSEISLYTQAAGGGLAFDRIMATSFRPNAMFGHDLDRDGHQDLVVLHGGSVLSAHFNGPSGLGPQYRVAGPYGSWFNTQGIGAGDINGDGCTEVVSANYDVGIVIHRGTGCAANADLALAMSARGPELAFTLDNLGAALAEDAETVIAIDVNGGSLDMVGLPADCTLVLRTPNSARITCLHGDIASGGRDVAKVTVSASNSVRRARIDVTAGSTSLTPETELGNNSVRGSWSVGWVPLR